MQLTPEVLQQFAETAVENLTQADSSIIAAYLCGSVLQTGNPLIGGTTDIDIVLIHTTEPGINREILRLTEDLHLDIGHHWQEDYRQGRELRVDPWMGPTLSNAKPLHDPRHFLDFTQASVRGLFYRADYKLQRARALLTRARQTWLGLQEITTAKGPNFVASYLGAVGNAANSVAVLTGEPLTERRFLLEFPQRIGALGLDQMMIAVTGLLGAHRVESEQIQSWIPNWSATYDAIPEEIRPAKLHPDRKDYYFKAFDAIIGSGDAKVVLWPLLCTWTLAASVLSASNPAVQGWRDALQKLELISSDMSDRVAALDSFLDQVDEVLLNWEQEFGF